MRCMPTVEKGRAKDGSETRAAEHQGRVKEGSGMRAAGRWGRAKDGSESWVMTKGTWRVLRTRRMFYTNTSESSVLSVFNRIRMCGS